MKLKVDTHTHSIASGHAYSTLQEMAVQAHNNGIEMFVLADHTSTIKGAPNVLYFRNLRNTISGKIPNVDVLAGAEANIIDYEGNIDMDIKTCRRLDYIIASFHNICIKPATIEEHTKAAINAIKNPYVDVIGHPGNPEFQIDMEKFVLVCKEQNKPIEINNHSSVARTGSNENCLEILKLCKKHNVKIACSTDAHISFEVGVFDNVYKMLAQVNISDKQIISLSKDTMLEYLEMRKKRIRDNQKINQNS